MLTPHFSYFGALKRRNAARVLLPLAAAALALAISWTVITAPAAAVESQAPVDPARDSAAHDVVPAALPTDISLPTLALPVEAPAAPAVEIAPVAVPSWQIGITSFGWQAELDACQWVLMDMVASVPLPIVAAHNYCGGGIVLEMQYGDTVTLSGYGLDGVYAVTGDRQASTGTDAATAISGMGGDVILQTCYWDNDGSERLVSLQRVG